MVERGGGRDCEIWNQAELNQKHPRNRDSTV